MVDGKILVEKILEKDESKPDPEEMLQTSEGSDMSVTLTDEEKSEKKRGAFLLCLCENMIMFSKAPSPV
jgi:hypothetical protein